MLPVRHLSHLPLPGGENLLFTEGQEKGPTAKPELTWDQFWTELCSSSKTWKEKMYSSTELEWTEHSGSQPGANQNYLGEILKSDTQDSQPQRFPHHWSE